MMPRSMASVLAAWGTFARRMSYEELLEYWSLVERPGLKTKVLRVVTIARRLTSTFHSATTWQAV